MTTTDEALVVFTTFPDEGIAAEVARSLVDAGLAACAQVVSAPIRSFYRWEGQLQDDRETLVLLKTSGSRWAELSARLSALHPYDVPQIVACSARSSAPYLKWLQQSCATSGPP